MDTKSFLLAADIKSTDAAAGTFEAILSMPTLDRDGEVIDARAFELLPKHIPIDIDHGMSTASIVGSGEPYYDGDVLKFKGSFASTPLGQEVRTLVTEGHVRKMSVAFMNAARETDPDDERVHIRRAELLNAAIVPIPSNREADILSAKTAQDARLDALLGPDVAAAIRSFMAAQAAEEPTKSPAADPETAAAPAAASPALALAKARAIAAQATALLAS